jgi:hypothetical protein
MLANSSLRLRKSEFHRRHAVCDVPTSAHFFLLDNLSQRSPRSIETKGSAWDYEEHQGPRTPWSLAIFDRQRYSLITAAFAHAISQFLLTSSMLFHPLLVFPYAHVHSEIVRLIP